jgi:hypothetical protein
MLWHDSQKIGKDLANSQTGSQFCRQIGLICLKSGMNCGSEQSGIKLISSLIWVVIDHLSPDCWRAAVRVNGDDSLGIPGSGL